MNSDLTNQLKKLSKDDESFQKLKELFKSLNEEKEKARVDLKLLEAAIRSDYDSILITELELEKPGPEIVYVNDGFTRMTGYNREEVIGKTPRILQGPKTDRAVLDKLKQRLQEGQAFFGHTVNYRKDGSEFINQWDIHPLTNEKGEITHWVSYQHDITERKRSEKKLLDTSVKFDDLIEESKKTLADIDEQGNIITSNKAFRDLTGFETDDLKSKKIWELLQDRHIEAFRHKFDKFKPSDFDDKTFVFNIRTKNGLPIEVKAATRLLNSNGHTVVRITFENKSLQRRIAKILQQKNHRYEKVFNKAVDYNYTIKKLDETYRFDHLSDNFSLITGLDLGEAASVPAYNFIHEADLVKFKNHVETVFKGKPNTETFRIKTKKGDYIEVIDYAKPEWDENHSEVIAIRGATSKEISSEKKS